MEKWKAKYAFHFPTPSTATRYLQKSMRYTNNPTGTKDRALQWGETVLQCRLQFRERQTCSLSATSAGQHFDSAGRAAVGLHRHRHRRPTWLRALLWSLRLPVPSVRERGMRHPTGPRRSAAHLATPLARQHAVWGRSSVPVE